MVERSEIFPFAVFLIVIDWALPVGSLSARSFVPVAKK